VEVLEGQPLNHSGQSFDVVVANLTAEVIITLMDDLVSCLAQEGLMILSGILSELAEDVERSLVVYGLKVMDRRFAGEWCAIIARRA
jgi:ribosomal protein L11 methyltransferase